MNEGGEVERIHIAPEQGAPVTPVDTAVAVSQRGIRGDRYFRGNGTFSDRQGCDITFIESEALVAAQRELDVSLEAGSHRRNVTTRGIDLTRLVGDRFRVGNTTCDGVERCAPCAYLEQHLDQPGLRSALIHRGGLRATIVDSGTVSVGDAIRLLGRSA